MPEPSRLVIVGGGLFGHEVLSWLEDVPAEQSGFAFKGFLDDNIVGERNGRPYLGGVDAYVPEPGDVFLSAIGATRPRLEICRKLAARGREFISFVHPTARVDRACAIGRGTIVGPFVYIGPGVSIGRYVILNVHSSVGHDSRIEDGCTMNCHADLTGRAVLEEGVYVGSHGSVLQRVTVGAFATVGAGSVAIRRVRPGTTVFGLPARSITPES